MTTLFQITVGYDDVNLRYSIAAYDNTRNEVTATANTLNKAWREIGDRIKLREKERKNFPLPSEQPKSNGTIITPIANGIELPPDRKIIIAGS